MDSEIDVQIYEDSVFIINSFYNYINQIIETSRKDFLRKYYIVQNRELLTSFEESEFDSSFIMCTDNYFDEDTITYNNIEEIFSDPVIIDRVKKLHIKHKKVLYYLFVKNYTMQEIADIMELSKGRISQIKDEAFERIRGM